MRHTSLVLTLILLLAAAAIIAVACGQPIPQPATGPQSSVAGVASATAVPDQSAEETAITEVVEPTATPTRTPRPTNTPSATPTRARAATPTRTATPTRRATRAATSRPSPTPTPQWPAKIVITEEQIQDLAGSNAVDGLTIQGLEVELQEDGTMVLSFDSLRYGFISLRQTTVRGQLVESDGRVSFVVTDIQPRNLATGAIPGFINQAMGQAFNTWYVEDLQTEAGQLELLVRPRGS